MRTFLVCCCIAVYAIIISCNSASPAPSTELIESINLKKGDAIWCGPVGGTYGSVDFLVSGSEEVRKDFDQATAMLHSFEYDESEKAYARIIKKDPACAMAYWGVAMSNLHPLWTAPTEDEFKKGVKAIEVARTVKDKTARESDYIEAMGQYFNPDTSLNHKSRCLKYEKAMEGVYTKYPDDKEAAIFYALALNATAEPTDKTYSNQRKAFEILNKIYTKNPNHPGIVHYIIHNYDNPELAELALPAARKYASVAPASAHAQHMPSHIFIRLGLWDEAITSNLASINSAKCYAESAKINGNWDEELHGLDYLVYAYLQQGNNTSAMEQWDYVKKIKKVSAQNLKVAYAYAAIPSRYVLENRQWKEAANIQTSPADFPWEKFPWQNAIVHFARLMGKAHTGDVKGAEEEAATLQGFQETLIAQKNPYQAKQVEVQLLAGNAWIQLKKGNNAKALELMQKAADLEDATEKHPVTPGEVLPARELLADMYMAMNQPAKALEVYEADMKRHPNRFNALYGAGQAAEKSGNAQKAAQYYAKLSEVAGDNTGRPELEAARGYLKSAQTVAHK